MAMKWLPRKTAEGTVDDGDGPMLIHALDGFLGAGSAARLAAREAPY